MDFRAAFILLVLRVSLIYANQRFLTCGYPTPTSVYTCGYDGILTINNEVQWTVQQHAIGKVNADVGAFYIRGATITSIPASTFNVLFSRVQYLYIEHSPEATFVTSLTAPFPRLRYITISGNSQLSIANNAFIHFPNLISLKLSGNSFASLTAPSFNGLTNLLDLDMSDNNPLIVPPNLFTNLVNLKSLNMNDSTVTLPATDQFTGLINLNSLYLNQAGLNSVPINSFGGLINLEFLYLSENSIANLQVGQFGGLTNLKELHLSKNGINTIATGTFNGLTSLYVLDLSENPSIVLTNGTFEGLQLLPSLVLRHNDIQHDELTSGILAPIANLTSIDLSYNNITRIVGGLFSNNRQLSYINLMNSGVNSIEYNFFDQFSSSEVRINLYGNLCTNYDFIVHNRNFHTIRDDLWDCFDNFSHAAGYKVPKLAIIFLVLVKFLGIL